MIVEASGNAALREVWGNYLARIVQIQMMLLPGKRTEGVYRKTIEGHRRIVAALRRRDPDAADDAIRRHLTIGLENACRLMETQKEGPSAGDGRRVAVRRAERNVKVVSRHSMS